MLRERLGVTPYETMDEAIAAAVAAARTTGRTSNRDVGRDVEPRADDPTARGTDGNPGPRAGGGS